MDFRGIFKKNYWVLALLVIFLLAWYIRCIPGTKLTYPQLLEIDTHYFLRLGEYIIENGTLPQGDAIAGWGTIPGGPNRNQAELVALWTYPLFYFMLHPFMPDITLYWIGVWVPAFLGALQVLFMYFLGKELFNSRKIGLLSAAFLAFAPGILYRSSAGWMDKEVIAGVFTVLGFCFFVKSFKEKEINKDAHWKYLIFHPFSIFDKLKLNDERIKIIKTVAYGFVAAFFFALLAGTSGQVRISLLLLAGAVMLSLILNRYSKTLFYAHVSTFVLYYIMSRAFAVSPGLTDVDTVMNIVVIVFMLVRYGAERFEIVEKKYLPFVVPSLVVAGIFVTGIVSYVYTDAGMWVSGIIERISNPMTLGVIPSTVAESQSVGHFFEDSLSNFGTGFAVSVFQWPQFMLYFSGIYLAVLGVMLMCYEFVFKKRNVEYLLVVVMFVVTLVLAIGAARLAFQFVFPFAIAAGYCLIRGGGYVLEGSKRMIKSDRGQQYVKITGGVLIGIAVFANFSSAWVMANNIRTPLTDDFYQAMTWLRENTPDSAVLLEWWDYGWWYQYIAKKTTLVDGGYHDQEPTQDIAQFYTNPLSDRGLNFLKNYTVDYVMVSSDLIPKFGAMSKIANWGAKIDVMPVFNLVKNYQEGDKMLLEYGGEGQTILVAYSVAKDGNETTLKNITALVKMPQGQAYVRDIGIGDQIIRNDRPNAIPGMIYFAGNAVIFIPEPVEDCVFVRLYLFNGAGMENYFEKLYDNLGIKIYKVKYENFPANITGEYVNTADL